MSMLYMVQAMKVKVGHSGRKLVLLKLADNANDQGICWPSYNTIADHCEMGRSTVKKHIKQLEDDGFLTVEERGGGRSSNRYILTLGSAQNKSRNVISKTPESDQEESDSGGGHILTRSDPDPVKIEPGQKTPPQQVRIWPPGGHILTPEPIKKPVMEPVTPSSLPETRLDRRGGELSDVWEPPDLVLQRIQATGVPLEFCLALVPEFRAYWLLAVDLPKSGSWEAAFMTHCRTSWLEAQNELGRQARKPKWEFEDFDWSRWYRYGEFNPDHVRHWLRVRRTARKLVTQEFVDACADVLDQAAQDSAVLFSMVVEEVALAGWASIRSDWLTSRFGVPVNAVGRNR